MRSPLNTTDGPRLFIKHHHHGSSPVLLDPAAHVRVDGGSYSPSQLCCASSTRPGKRAPNVCTGLLTFNRLGPVQKVSCLPTHCFCVVSHRLEFRFSPGASNAYGTCGVQVQTVSLLCTRKAHSIKSSPACVLAITRSTPPFAL